MFATSVELPLATESLLLRRFDLEDAALVFALSRESTLRKWLPDQVYLDIDEARSVLEFLVRSYDVPGDPHRAPYVLAVQHRDSGELIGHVGFSAWQEDVEVGFAIGERHQHRGFAAEAVGAASRWTIEAFALARILGITEFANLPSQRSLLRAGYAEQSSRVVMYRGVEQTVRVYAFAG